MAPAWGSASASPFCTKLETWLRMADLPHEARVLTGPPRSPNRKVPYVQLPDGRLLADTGPIIATLTAEYGVTLDAELDAEQRARTTFLTRLLEDHFYWFLIWDRWAVASHWARTKVTYFGALPVPLRWLVPIIARRGVLRAMHGQGFGRMNDEALLERARQDLDALSQSLGERSFFIDEPSSIDATAHAFLSAALRPPFDGPLQRLVAEYPSLTAFCDRVDARWY